MSILALSLDDKKLFRPGPCYDVHVVKAMNSNPFPHGTHTHTHKYTRTHYSHLARVESFADVDTWSIMRIPHLYPLWVNFNNTK